MKKMRKIKRSCWDTQGDRLIIERWFGSQVFTIDRKDTTKSGWKIYYLKSGRRDFLFVVNKYWDLMGFLGRLSSNAQQVILPTFRQYVPYLTEQKMSEIIVVKK
ncbi:hypothetical protein KKA50_01240 [Patescibacteria group bacterium]|nr:hypothetical protein [Patescibacteria group bacterium]